MIWDMVYKMIKRVSLLMIAVILLVMTSGCGDQIEAENNDPIESTKIEGVEMKLYIDDVEIPVSWENNSTVAELMDQAQKSDITVAMSKYSTNEQVGSLGRKYTRDDKQTTTHNGDIVLYAGSNIVVFYGSNSWAYTRLGKMNLPEEEVTELLSNNDVTITIKK